jgi:AraC-like DNA-binding protein
MKTPNPALAHYQFSNEKMIIFDSHTHKLIPEPVFDMHLPPELGVVLSGKMARFSNNIRAELPRGGVWIGGILEPHGRQAIEDKSKVAVFIVSTDFFHHMVIPGIDNHVWQTPFNTPPERRPTLINEEFALLAERLIAILDKGGTSAQESGQIQLTLLEIILHMHRLGKFDDCACSTVSDLGRLRPALDLIYHSSKSVDTDEAAKLCKLSPSRFNQLFIQATRLSFSRFSLRHRLSQVAYDLKNGTNSLDELAEKWGFANKSHLVHRFREHYNRTPKQYRVTK